MHVRNFVRFGWLGLAIAAAFMGPVASGAAAPGPADGLVIDQTPNPGVYGNIIWSISALGTREAWAVGGKATQSSNDTLALHWNGTSWTAVATPNPEVQCEDGDIMWAGQALTGVSGVSANDVWAVGGGCYGISPVTEHWNGTAWSLVPGARLGGPDGGDEWASLSDVHAISGSNVWAVGYVSSGNGRPLIEHWSGTGWSEVQGAGAPESYLASLGATGPNDVWAVGGTGAGTNLIEHWNGTAWSVVATPQPAGSSLDSVAAISPVNAWAVGSRRASTGADVTFVLHWDGRSWSEVPSPNPSTTGDAVNQLRSVAALAPNDVWAVGMYENEQTSIHQQRTLVLHWDGSQWSIVSSPQPGRTSQFTDAAASRAPGIAVSSGRLFVAGFFSYYDRNIYDGHYTLPETLVAHR
jgi:hypothetical protein